jgi:hypothetical protein
MVLSSRQPSSQLVVGGPGKGRDRRGTHIHLDRSRDDVNA